MKRGPVRDLHPYECLYRSRQLVRTPRLPFRAKTTSLPAAVRGGLALNFASDPMRVGAAPALMAAHGKTADTQAAVERTGLRERLGTALAAAGAVSRGVSPRTKCGRLTEVSASAQPASSAPASGPEPSGRLCPSISRPG